MRNHIINKCGFYWNWIAYFIGAYMWNLIINNRSSIIDFKSIYIRRSNDIESKREEIMKNIAVKIYRKYYIKF